MRKTTIETRSFSLAAILSIGLILTACGGGGGSRVDQVTNHGSSSSSSSTSSASSSLDTTQVRALGRGHGSGFVPGEIAVGIGDNQLSAGGSTLLTVNLVSGSNNLVTEPLEVTFNSPCIARQEAVLSATRVTTSNGEASTTYTASGCVGEDQVTATAVFNNTILTASATIEVAADTIGSIQFIDATPTIISLKGTGNSETAVVRFRVLGSTEAPIKDVDVNFTLNSTVGGLSLVNTSGRTNSGGYVTATVNSGTVSTSVRVTATAVEAGISAQSSALLVSTGIPDQKSMSLATSSHNPVGWNFDGATADLTVRLADAFNNPAPDGTAVYFTTEGGAIDSGCTTADGACTVTWRSQAPRPGRGDNSMGVYDLLCTDHLDPQATDGDQRNNDNYRRCAAKRAGRVTILATAIGNESFVDKNGDGYYESSIDSFATEADGGNCERNAPISSAEVSTGSSVLPCDDLAEAYLDKNESGRLHSFMGNEVGRDNDEYFVDFNNNQNYDAGNGIYNGVLCSSADEAAGSCSKDSVTIRKDIVIVMACHEPLTDINNRLPGQPTSSTVLAPGESTSIEMILADCNGNGLPAGTTVTLNTTGANNVTASHSLTGALPSSTEWRKFNLNLKASDQSAAIGQVSINISVPTPHGNIVSVPEAIEFDTPEIEFDTPE